MEEMSEIKAGYLTKCGELVFQQTIKYHRTSNCIRVEFRVNCWV